MRNATLRKVMTGVAALLFVCNTAMAQTSRRANKKIESLTVTNGVVITGPIDAVLESGIQELVGKDEQVDQNEYGASVCVTLGGTYSGEVIGVTLVGTELDSGAVPAPAGTLYLLDADPGTTAGDATISAAEHKTVMGQKAIAAADFVSDANGSHVHYTVAIPFHALSSLCLLYFHTDATSINDGGTDDEVYEMNLWIRRDS
jgi:hypothetical protein